MSEKDTSDEDDFMKELEAIDNEKTTSNTWTIVVFAFTGIFVLLAIVFIYLYAVNAVRIKEANNQLEKCQTDTETANSDIQNYTDLNTTCQAQLKAESANSLGIYTFDTTSFIDQIKVFYQIFPTNINSNYTGVYPTDIVPYDGGQNLLSKGQYPKTGDIVDGGTLYEYAFAPRVQPKDNETVSTACRYWQLHNRLSNGWSFEWLYTTAQKQDGGGIDFSFLKGNGTGTEQIINSGSANLGSYPSCVAIASLNTINVSSGSQQYKFSFVPPIRDFVVILSHPDNDTSRVVATLGFLG